MTNFDESQIRRGAPGNPGQFAEKQNSAAEDNVLPQVPVPVSDGQAKPVPHIDAHFEVLAKQKGGSQTLWSYEEALAVAGGDPKKVWSVVDGDYPVGTKIWKFDLDGDEEVVTAETEAEATEKAAETYDNRYNDGNPVDPDALFIDRVYAGDAGDYEDEWTELGNTYVIPGNHFVNRVGYIATADPWTDENSEYTWG